MSKAQFKKTVDDLKKLRNFKNDINDLGNEMLGHLHMTIKEYVHLHPQYLEKVFKDFFREHSLSVGGSDYFSWTPEKKIQKDFEKFVLEQMKSEAKYLFFKGEVYFLQSVQKIWTVRSVIENTNFSFDEHGFLVYSYSGTTYNGFGRLQHTCSQQIVIDIDKLKIIEFRNSGDRRKQSVGKFVNLNLDFLKLEKNA